MTVRCSCFALLIGVVLIADPASARRPWKPKVSVPPNEGIGRLAPILDPGVRRRFTRTYNQGRRLLLTGRYRKARAILTEAIRLHPDHAGARLDRARVMLTLGYLTWSPALVQKAHADVMHGLRIAPEDRDLLLLKALIKGLLERMDTLPRAPRRRKPAG